VIARMSYPCRHTSAMDELVRLFGCGLADRDVAGRRVLGAARPTGTAAWNWKLVSLGRRVRSIGGPSGLMPCFWQVGLTVLKPSTMVSTVVHCPTGKITISARRARPPRRRHRPAAGCRDATSSHLAAPGSAPCASARSAPMPRTTGATVTSKLRCKLDMKASVRRRPAPHGSACPSRTRHERLFEPVPFRRTCASPYSRFPATEQPIRPYKLRINHRPATHDRARQPRLRQDERSRQRDRGWSTCARRRPSSLRPEARAAARPQRRALCQMMALYPPRPSRTEKNCLCALLQQ